MSDVRSKLSNLLGLLAPSPLSAIICVTLAVATLVLSQVESIRSFLLLPKNLEVFRTLAVGADTVLTSTIGESRTNVVVVGVFWAIVGLAVYLFLRGVARYIAELDDAVEVRHYVWPKGANRDSPLLTTLKRTLFRGLALVALLALVFGPLADTLKGPVLVDLIGTNQHIQNAVWFIASLLLWHAVVVLLRLVLLRQRLIGEL